MTHTQRPPATPLRQAVERRSIALLARLHGTSRLLIGLGVLALVVVGLLVRNPAGGVALLVVAGLIGWLLYLSWPVQTPTGRLVRLAALGLVVYAALVRLL